MQAVRRTQLRQTHMDRHSALPGLARRSRRAHEPCGMRSVPLLIYAATKSVAHPAGGASEEVRGTAADPARSERARTSCSCPAGAPPCGCGPFRPTFGDLCMVQGKWFGPGCAAVGGWTHFGHHTHRAEFDGKHAPASRAGASRCTRAKVCRTSRVVARVCNE